LSELKNANGAIERLRTTLMLSATLAAWVAAWFIIAGHYHFVLFFSMSSYVFGENLLVRRSALELKNDPWKYFFNEKINIVFHAVLSIIGIVLSVYELLNY
jgi:hypothetical protein